MMMEGKSSDNSNNNTVTMLAPSSSTILLNMELTNERKILFIVSSVKRGYFMVDVTEDTCSAIPKYSPKENFLVSNDRFVSIDANDGDRIITRSKIFEGT